MQPNTTAATRVTALDALRGLVMIIMALDHVRDFFHAGSFQFQPDDLSRTTVILFFTRWITHVCAPVFMFAAGGAAYIRRRNCRSSPTDLSPYLWKRGLWLALLELTVLRVALTFHLLEGPILLTVLWALGWSMVALGFLSRLPIRLLAILSLAVIALHNLTDATAAAISPGGSPVGNFWKILHQQGVISIGGMVIVVAYPLIPWIAVMASGFCCGEVLVMDPARRRRWLLRLGAGLTAGFAAIRLLNVYGDPQPWAVQASPAFTLLSFLRCTKYPPSLDFLLMTLGPALLLLAWFYRIGLPAYHPLVVIGRVPLFYFLGHMLLAHLLTIRIALIHYGRAGFIFSPPGPANVYPAGYGYPLGIVYLVWLLVIALMYPACVWFGRLKARNSSPWLAYL
jgi:uncharacterized membrane protein